MSEIRAFVAAMPKVELHVHLMGALATGDDAQRFKSFSGFASAYGRRERRVRSGADITAAVAQLADRLAASRVRYAEVTVTPLPHLEHGIPPDDLADALDAGRRAAVAEHGLRIAWVFDVSSDAGPRAGLETADWALRHAVEGTVGFGLGGPEVGVPRSMFRAAFDRAIAGGLHSVPHAGESGGPESVWSALRDLRAERIGHGVQSVHDPALVDHLATHRVPLEVCPTSNLCTGVIATPADHPLPALLAAGVPITLATDNPAIFGTGLNDEYVLAHEALGLSRVDLLRIAGMGVEAAFCAPELKAQLRSELGRFSEAQRTGAG